jgi:ABC-2 type transport system permease protein
MTTPVLTGQATPTGRSPRVTPHETLAGLGTMSRLFWRRNRVRLVVWAVFVIAMVGYVISYYQSIFTTQASLDDFARVSDTPGIKALTGLAANPATMGGAVWTKIWMFVAVALAIGAVFLVTRNGRADEETGRTELLRSRVLGLHAGSVATWLWVAGLCLVSGLGAALVSAVMGLDPAGSGITGSLLFGLSVTGAGLFGLGVGAVAGQVTSTSRGANTLGSVVVVGFYVVRMVGDLGNGALTWVSPIGWAQQVEPWGANRWWPLGLLVVLTAVLLTVAGRIEERRDHGAGLLPERLGKPGAPHRWASPLALALRLQRGPILGWAIAVVLTAGLFGSVVESMTDLLDDAAASATDLIGGTGVDALLAMLTSLIALVVAVFAVQSAVSLRGDEASAILEPQLAGAIGRVRWAAERLVIPVVGSAVLLAVGGGIFGASYGSTISDPSQAARLAGAALVYWPAIMVLTGVAVLLFGYLPRLAVALSWGVIAAVWFLMFVGDALGLPQGLLDVLPWSATPYVPLQPLTWAPLLVMTLVAAAFTALGLLRFRARDLQPA